MLCAVAPRSRRPWAGLLVVLCLALPAYAQSPAAALRICHEDENNFPWVLKHGKGASVILVDMAAARTGMRLVLEPMPWRRCLALLERGQVVGALGVSHTRDRARFAAYPMTRANPPMVDDKRRVSMDEYSLYRAVGSGLGWNGQQFSGLTGRIGYQTAFSIGEHLQRLGVEPFDGAKSPEVILRRVAMQTLQGAALLTHTGDHLLTLPEFAGKLEKVTPPLVAKPFFLVFGKAYYSAHARAVEDLWDAIEQVRKSPEYRAQEAALIAAGK